MILKRRRIACLFFTGLLCVFIATFGLMELAVANPVPVYSLEMSEEYIDYTICTVNGSQWAKVDGKYPINKLAICDLNQTGDINNYPFTFIEESLQLIYPMPPDATNISIKMDETELSWNNYTQEIPDTIHYTTIGDWPVISCTLDPVPKQFLLQIHYEHPIAKSNGTYTFLYDLNISPYLSTRNNQSTAYFKITFETNITDLQTYTVTTDGKKTPVEYTTTKLANTGQTISLNVTSNYSEPLPGDLLILFSENKQVENDASVFFSSSLLLELSYYVIATMTFALIVLIGYLFIKQKKRSDNE